MNRRTGFIATAVGIALFGVWLWSGVSSHARVECEVCVTFEGRSACRTALGPDQDEAADAARRNACALLTGGVTEAFACGRVAPTSVDCRRP